MQVHLTDYPQGGDGFTEYTVEQMQRLVGDAQHDPAIVKAARTVVAPCRSKDYYCEAERIFHWVKDNIRYTRDPHNAEWVQAPDVTLREGHADCDCGAVLLASLFSSIGLASGFEAIRAERNHPDEYSHIYAIVKTPRGWRAADWTVPESHFGWSPTRAVFGRRVFLNK